MTLRLGQPATTLRYRRTSDGVVDHIGSYGADHSFNAAKRKVEGALFNQGPATLTTGSVSNSLPNNFTATSPSAVFLDPSTTDTEAWNRAVSSTNPSRPDILLPAFLAELRDLPRMIKYGAELGAFIASPQFRRRVLGYSRFSDWDKDPAVLTNLLKPTPGNAISATKQLAIANLAIQFGWLPFLGDLSRLDLLASSVNSRRKEIDRLLSGNGLKRMVRLDEASSQGQNTQILSTLTGGSKSGPVRYLRSMQRWAVVRWKPTGINPLPPSDNQIRQMLTGLSLNAIGSIAWELLPWSWLADYFGNVGTTLNATNNFLGARAKGTVMTERRETLSVPHLYWAMGADAGASLTPGRRQTVWKYRSVHSGVHLPSFGIPILGTRQLSILGSIYATRAFR